MFTSVEAHLTVSARARCYLSERIPLSPREHRALFVSVSVSVGAHFTFPVRALCSLSERIHCLWESTSLGAYLAVCARRPCSLSERVSLFPREHRALSRSASCLRGWIHVYEKGADSSNQTHSETCKLRHVYENGAESSSPTHSGT